MHLSHTSKLLSSCLATGLLTFSGASLTAIEQPRDRLALIELAGRFHGASSLADYDMEYGLWTEDAEFHGGPNHLFGRDAIVEFFTTDPTWGTSASLTPSYKTEIDVQGNTATVRFECVILDVTGGTPTTTSFASQPPGSQNPAVEIFQHSTATVTAVKQGGVWRIHRFNGAGGPILP
jgi:hypothetical protein